MKDLSLHILDIAQNSTRAKASLVEIFIAVDTSTGVLSLSIRDNGTGMPESLVKMVDDPFVTTRTTRKVGLGIPLLKQRALQCEGSFVISSKVGEGTSISATFKLDNIDTPPLGDIAGVIAMLASGHPSIDFVYTHIYNEKSYVFDTREVKEVLGSTPINEPSIVIFLKQMISENLDCVND